MTDPSAAVGHEAPAERGSVPARVLAGVVRGYQLIVSPWFAPTCRYYPSCSAYGIAALHRHGALKGSLLTGWRLLRCNPWSHGGVDPVPERGRWTSEPPPRLDLDAEVDDGGAAALEGRIAGLSGEAVPSEAGPRAGTAPARAHRTRRPE